MSHSVRDIDEWDFSVLETVGNEYITPVYFFDIDRVRENCRRMKNIFSDFQICYAGKANTSPGIIKAVNEEGLSIVCGSMYEVQQCLQAGFNESDIQWTAVNPPNEQINILDENNDLKENMTVTVGAVDTIEKLNSIGFTGKIFIRVNPNDGLGYAGHGESKARQAKFGIPEERLQKAYNKVSDEIKVRGLHVHVGSNLQTMDEIDDYINILRDVVSLARSVDFNIDEVNIGGGIGIPYADDKDELNYNYIAEKISSVFDSEDFSPVMEPGRIFVADAGILLTEVNTVKETQETTVVGVDAGIPSIVRQVIFEAQHPIRNITNTERQKVEQSVSGPTCTGVDVLCLNRKFTKCEKGDIIAIGNAGAYTSSLANNFHGIPRPSVIYLKDDEVIVKQEREKPKDAFSH